MAQQAAARLSAQEQQEQRAAELGVVAGFHPGVDQRFIQVVDPELAGVVCADDEFVLPGLRRQHGALPADAKQDRVELFRVRARGREVEFDDAIDPVDDPLVVVESAGVEVFTANAALFAPLAGSAERADQIGDRIAVLLDGQPRQLDPGRSIPRPGRR